MSDESQAGHEPEEKDAEQVPAQAEAIQDLAPEDSEHLANVKGGWNAYR